MRWDLFAILMLLPWAATFGGSLMAARLRVEGKKGQGAAGLRRRRDGGRLRLVPDHPGL